MWPTHCNPLHNAITPYQTHFSHFETSANEIFSKQINVKYHWFKSKEKTDSTKQNPLILMEMYTDKLALLVMSNLKFPLNYQCMQNIGLQLSQHALVNSGSLHY